MGGIVNAGLDIVGLGPASKQSKATTQAADASAAAARYAADLQRQMFEKQIALQEPFRQAGLTGQNRLLQLLGLGKNTGGALYGKYARDFSMKDFQTDPGYAFRMKEGLTALDRQAAARGGLISGGALKAAQRYGQDLGSQEYMNAFNRYQTNRANQLAPLQSLAGLAQTSANTLGSAAANYGTNAGNIAMTAGTNQANAYLNQGNIGASQYANYGRALDEALNTDWSKVRSNIGGLFG